jgi:site-specific DNA recombinase
MKKQKSRKKSSESMKIGAYCRVSIEKEAQIDSLEKQIEFFNDFTKRL